MATYIVTSNRLNGMKRGDVIELDETSVNIEALIEAGHISTHEAKKSAKPIKTEKAKD